TQGSVQTPVSITGYPLTVGNVLTSTVESLTPNTTYYYSVTPQGNTSAVSNQIQVTTALNDAVPAVRSFNLTWLVLSDGIMVRNLPLNSRVSVFNLMGEKISTFNTNTDQANIKLNHKGIYLLKVQKDQDIQTCKIRF
ncbi:MAG: T9SS type A sorting domain-containing protein, partial [Paludibacter sp.]